MKDLKPYIVKLKKDETIKTKIYLDDYIIKDQN